MSSYRFSFRRSVHPRRKLRLSDGTNATSGQIFRRMCKLTESLRVNEIVTAEGRTFALGLDEHKKIKKAVEACGICST